MGREVSALGSQILHGNGDLKDLNAVQRLGRAAAQPLILLARHLASLLVSSTYSSTAWAVTGSLGVVRIGMGQIITPSGLHCSNVFISLRLWQTCR